MVLHSDGHGMCDITRRVAGTVDVKDADRGRECLKWETQSFSDQGVDEGDISSTIQQCGDSVVVLSVLNSNSHINEELAVLVDSVGINVFRDLVSDRKGTRFFFVVFVDGIVTVLFPYHSVLLFFHTQCLLTWRGRRIYTNTAYLFLRTASSFCFFDLSMDLANS